MEIQKGTIKREIAKIELKDFEISNIIIPALLEKGFDIVSKPLNNNPMENTGEQITIYKVEQR